MWVLRFGVSVVSPHLHKEAVSVLGFSSLIRAPGLLRALRWALRTREVWGRRPPGAPHQGGPRAASQREPLPGRAGTAPPCGGGDPTARGRAVTPRRSRSPRAVNGRSRPTPHPDPGGGRGQRRTWLLGSARLEEPLLAARAGRGSAGAPSGLASPGGKAKAQPVAAAADESRSRLRPCFPPGGDPAPPLSAGPAPPRPAPLVCADRPPGGDVPSSVLRDRGCPRRAAHPAPRPPGAPRAPAAAPGAAFLLVRAPAGSPKRPPGALGPGPLGARFRGRRCAQGHQEAPAPLRSKSRPDSAQGRHRRGETGLPRLGAIWGPKTKGARSPRGGDGLESSPSPECLGPERGSAPRPFPSDRNRRRWQPPRGAGGAMPGPPAVGPEPRASRLLRRVGDEAQAQEG